MMRYILITCMVFMLAACGSVATPVYDAPAASPTHDSASGEPVAVQPSATPQPPTATPEPPTSTPTELPTEAPTEVPTEAAAEIVDDLKILIDLANPSSGAKLFNETYFVTDLGEWQCITCHNTATEEVKIGPGLFNVIDHATTRIDGMGPYTYIYNSVRESQAFIVPGFESAAPMPHFTKEILTDGQLYDIIAYLATLK